MHLLVSYFENFEVARKKTLYRKVYQVTAHVFFSSKVCVAAPSIQRRKDTKDVENLSEKFSVELKIKTLSHVNFFSFLFHMSLNE
jgi:hypothetical protein